MITNPTTQTTTETNERKGMQMTTGLKVRSSVKAGGLTLNHSEAKAVQLRTRVGGAGRRTRMGVAAMAAVAALGAGGAVVVDASVSPASAAADSVSSCGAWRCGFNHSEARALRLRAR